MNFIFVTFFGILLFSFVYTNPTINNIIKLTNSGDVSSVNRSPTLYKQIIECLHSNESLICLKERMLEILNDVVISDRIISITDMIDLIKDNNYPMNKSNEDMAIILPKNMTEKNIILDDMILDKFDQFLQSRSLKINLAPVFEGRKKKDKYGGMAMMAGLAMAGMMAQLAMGKVAFMAGAALLIAKIALVMSSLIGLKKLVGGSGGSEHVVVTAAAPSSDHGHGGYGGGWQRSLDPIGLGNSLAYRAYYPVNITSENFHRRK